MIKKYLIQSGIIDRLNKFKVLPNKFLPKVKKEILDYVFLFFYVIIIVKLII